MEKDTKPRVGREIIEEAEVVEPAEIEAERRRVVAVEEEVVRETDKNLTRGSSEGGDDLGEVSWQAREYIVRDKTSWWYVGLIAVGLILSGIAVWLQWWTFLAVVILSVVALVIYAKRPPRMIDYSLTKDGLREGEKLYPYEQFKAFGLLQEGGNFAIVLMPRKRFSPRVIVYFPQAQGEEIVDWFGARLPMEEVKMDFLDKLIKFLRI